MSYDRTRMHTVCGYVNGHTAPPVYLCCRILYRPALSPFRVSSTSFTDDALYTLDNRSVLINRNTVFAFVSWCLCGKTGLDCDDDTVLCVQATERAEINTPRDSASKCTYGREREREGDWGKRLGGTEGTREGKRRKENARRARKRVSMCQVSVDFTFEFEKHRDTHRLV